MSQTHEADAKTARDAWIRALQRVAAIEEAGVTMPVLIDQLALEFGGSQALVSNDGSLSYREIAPRSRQYARWALSQGLKAGDVVALLMPNRADYVAMW